MERVKAGSFVLFILVVVACLVFGIISTVRGVANKSKLVSEPLPIPTIQEAYWKVTLVSSGINLYAENFSKTADTLTLSNYWYQTFPEGWINNKGTWTIDTGRFQVTIEGRKLE
jgi:hypothetical protein